MALRAVVFDEKGNKIKEVSGDLVMAKGIEYKPYPFGIGLELYSASAGKLIPETVPEIFSTEINTIIDKVVKEKRGETTAEELRIKTAFLVASGGRQN